MAFIEFTFGIKQCIISKNLKYVITTLFSNLSGGRENKMAAGIWQGRFQFVHNGHYYIFQKEIPKFENKIITIVNPNPNYPAFSNFARFNDNRNPFNYFQRMLIWKRLADESNIDVTIVPCWHPRYKIALENDFLPSPANRFWIIPIAQDDAEEDKARDLKRKGEKIHQADFTSENDEFARISASMVRQSVSQGTDLYRKYVPKCIQSLTKDIYQNIDRNHYIIVPVIDDGFDLKSIQRAVSLLTESEEPTYILFMLTVHTSSGELEWKNENDLPWWFKPAKHPNHGSSFYRRCKIIEALMKELGISRFLVTPVFVMNNDLEVLSSYNSAFLPYADNSSIIINQSINADNYYKYNFLYWIDAIDLEDKILNTSDEEVVNPVIKDYFMGIPNKFRFERSISDENYCETLLEEAKHYIEITIDYSIEEARHEISNGGLKPDQRDQLKSLVDSVYPSLRIRYLAILKGLNKNAGSALLEQRVSNIKKEFNTELTTKKGNIT